jgi:uncharacterized membrane protein YkvA (DUF1232 family)
MSCWWAMMKRCRWLLKDGRREQPGLCCLPTSGTRLRAMSVFETIREWARRIKRDAVMLWFAYRNPATPLLVKALCVFVVAYALSPIDLIPDFIPVLGYVDDALLLPALIWLAVRLLPKGVIDDSRVLADAWLVDQGKRPTSYAGAAFIVVLWLLVAYAGWVWYRG